MNHGRELRMGTDIRKKGKVEKAIKFAKRMKKVQEKAKVALRKAQKKMKWQADRERKEVEKQKKEDKAMLSTKDLVFKERLARKIVD